MISAQALFSSIALASSNLYFFIAWASSTLFVLARAKLGSNIPCFLLKVASVAKERPKLSLCLHQEWPIMVADIVGHISRAVITLVLLIPINKTVVAFFAPYGVHQDVQNRESRYSHHDV